MHKSTLKTLSCDHELNYIQVVYKVGPGFFPKPLRSWKLINSNLSLKV